MHIAFISSSVPRKCGIATYTRDIIDQLVLSGERVSHIAMQNNGDISYPPTVTHVIRQENKDDYLRVAEELNKSDVDIVHLQHEFGLYGGEDGEYILLLLKKLKKPFIVTFHTVLLEPDGKKKYITQELARMSQAIVVMEPIAQDRLVHVYDVNPHDVHTIYHGVPEIATLTKEESKKKLGFENTFLLISNNLISRNKGFEYVIKALPSIVKKIPGLKFLVIGETHPMVKKYEGESYREELETLVRKNHLEKNVTFMNEYVSLSDLRTYLAAADVCITPYLDPQQITSGTLSYAIGVGKACISTPYIYAEHILDKGRGILVPFRNEKSMADAIWMLYSNPKKRSAIEKKAWKYGQEMRWPQVAHKHLVLYRSILKRHEDLDKKTLAFIKAPPKLSYFEYFTDKTGIFQHAHFTIPDLKYGYCTDDNGRALIVASDTYAQTKSEKANLLITTYVKFLYSAQTEEGKFHTFMDSQQKWLDTPGVTDAYGRAMWGLGYHLYVCPTSSQKKAVENMFQNGMKQIAEINYIYIAAYTILGLHYYIKAVWGKKDTADEALTHLLRLADMLVTAYETSRSDEWEWFEDSMRYDIFRLPQALFAAFLITGKKRYKEVALKTMGFAEKVTYDSEKGYFDFIGSDGWYPKGKVKAVYDQQPLEPAAAADCFIFASIVTKKKDYVKKALVAYEWYFGRNRNYTVMYDLKTGGVFDGLKSSGINQNEGAENIVCFLISKYLLQAVLDK